MPSKSISTPIGVPLISRVHFHLFFSTCNSCASSPSKKSISTNCPPTRTEPQPATHLSFPGRLLSRRKEQTSLSVTSWKLRHARADVTLVCRGAGGICCVQVRERGRWPCRRDRCTGKNSPLAIAACTRRNARRVALAAVGVDGEKHEQRQFVRSCLSRGAQQPELLLSGR